jgi:hypothetical protein
MAAMTLVEMMIVTSLMLLVVTGVMSANYIGLRENQLMASKAGANNTSRIAVNQMLQDIRGAKGYQIGNVSGTNNAFTPITNGVQQRGIALELYPIVISTNEALNTSIFTLYYFDSSDSANNDGRLWRCDTNQVYTVVASNLINTLYFTSEDYTGTPQSARTYKGIIHTTLQFCEFQYPLTMIGSNYLFNAYRIDCRATPHLPDGP